MKTLYERLKEYSKSDIYGFHMPGHKRNDKVLKASFPFDIDITEIEGFDDLHHSNGIIKEAEKRAAALYQSEETHFLVNGSTVGILSAIMGCTGKGDKILVARNCHKSVYHAVFMQELLPVYVYPRYDEELQLNGELLAKEVDRKLKEEGGIKAAVLVSPTYDGVISDIEAIAALCHSHGIPLIVDEAHGAHLGFHPYFASNANVKGADIVIHSTHKTMPALTQTALLHMNGELVDREQVRMYLRMLQSSSPSYVLMASMDACMDWIERKGAAAFEEYATQLKLVRESLAKLRYLKLIRTEHYDDSKLVISTKDTTITGDELSQKLLHTANLQTEMCTPEYVVAMTSPADTKEGFRRLLEALFVIDKELGFVQEKKVHAKPPQEAEVVCTSASLRGAKSKSCIYEDAVGKISTEYAYLYPPGIPILVPGERITEQIVEILNYYRSAGFHLEGTSVENRIGVWING